MHPSSRRAHLPPFALVLLLSSLAWLLLTARAEAVKLGVLGDSLSDEYEEESYGSYAENWVEQLVLYRGIDIGPTASQAGQPNGSWGEPRRTGYEYNWARAGATTDTLLSDGQHSGLAGQVASQGITHAVMAIGANDFAPGSAAYNGIYFGTWSSSQIDAYVNQRLANVDAALDTVLPTGVKLVLLSFPDYGVTPTVKFFYPDPAKRQLVSDVIQQVNTGIDGIAQTRQLPLADLFGASLAIFGPHGSSNSTLTLGNVDIDLLAFDTSAGGNPTAGFVDDGIHPNTTLQGVMANTFLEALNAGYAANLLLFSEQEILAHRGLAYGGSDTLVTQLGEYSDYVRNYASAAACSDGIDNDGDGSVDFPDDPGCADAGDLSEHTLLLVCDDGIDNDGDGDADYPGDPGCVHPADDLEGPQCDDDQDNDGDGKIDWDGGSGGGVPDPECANAPLRNNEQRAGGCGLGFELTFVLLPLIRLRRRLRGRAV